MRVMAALASGIAGACTLTAIHEAARHSVDHAPQVQAIGKRALRKGARLLGRRSPDDRQLYRRALAGELISNSLYFALAGLGGTRRSVQVGAVLGVAGGIGAFALPEHLGLGRLPDRKTPQTQWMTTAWYTAGGVVAGLVFRRLGRSRPRSRAPDFS